MKELIERIHKYLKMTIPNLTEEKLNELTNIYLYHWRENGRTLGKIKD